MRNTVPLTNSPVLSRKLSEEEIEQVSGGVFHVVVGGVVGVGAYALENYLTGEQMTLGGAAIAFGGGMVGGRIIQSAVNISKNVLVQKTAEIAATAGAAVVGTAGNVAADTYDGWATGGGGGGSYSAGGGYGMGFSSGGGGGGRTGTVTIIDLN